MSIQQVLQSLDGIQEWQEETYKYLHAHPELSMQETQTAQFIFETLQGYGYQTQLIGGGVVGVLQNGDGPTVLFRADMDGLPIKEKTGLDYASQVVMKDLNGDMVPVMHACGHDVHIVAGLGAAWALALHLDEWQGTYIALFQPGEEIAAGAKAMIADGLFEKIPHPQVALSQHVLTEPVAGKVGTRSGSFLSSAASLSITIYGQGAHGSMPHLSVDPIVIGSSIVMKLQTIVSREMDPFQFAVVSVGSFQAGLKANIIPDTANLQVNIRTYNEKVQQQVLDSIKRIVHAECEAAGCTTSPKIKVFDYYPLTENDAKITAEVTEAFETYLGKERVVAYHPMTASEDFSYIPQALNIPYLYWGFGGFTEDQTSYANHNPKFAPAIQPTLRTGTEAAIIAVLCYLGK
ncbi:MULTISPECIES: amidohydrolase [unclassified Streptococcus]|uniref:amidohydrolase n=1 Tax=unclassified Streptococcus TaxID=2608887 RepID=UPI0010718906|nr:MULTISPECIES: amidohydrolase [unclassified Streptococcus]MBF0786872.1 amidohydrolase [Streptococcus sp. 19428wC2_LYSM12]MCQ9212717.1 amidohydrolase [Streptococcus sp. B01]MCQ9214058.1 amidohydrolase [Streptococcus sp. O1]TFV06241.1 amidohydrolase [Streptococcus sp. LYSM12]